MSSKEIADLLEVRHDKVKQSIERLSKRGIFAEPPMGDLKYRNARGAERTEKAYLLEKRDSYVVVAQLSPEFTARVVDRCKSWSPPEQETRPRLWLIEPPQTEEHQTKTPHAPQWGTRKLRAAISEPPMPDLKYQPAADYLPALALRLASFLAGPALRGRAVFIPHWGTDILPHLCWRLRQGHCPQMWGRQLVTADRAAILLPQSEEAAPSALQIKAS